MTSPDDTIPDWLQEAYEQSIPLSITEFFLMGPAPKALAPFYEPNLMTRGMSAMQACYKSIKDLERQLLNYFQFKRGWTGSLSTYTLGENAEHIQQFPLQLAVIIAETITLATGENHPKESMQAAVNGLALQMVERAQANSSLADGVCDVTAELLERIEPIAARQTAFEAQRRARIRFLREVVMRRPTGD